jgi:hypothetical protein
VDKHPKHEEIKQNPACQMGVIAIRGEGDENAYTMIKPPTKTLGGVPMYACAMISCIAGVRTVCSSTVDMVGVARRVSECHEPGCNPQRKIGIGAHPPRTRNLGQPLILGVVFRRTGNDRLLTSYAGQPGEDAGVSLPQG